MMLVLTGTAHAGIVGPYMIGALKAKFQGYTVPMLVMTCVNSLAVVYFAILLPFLPAKSSKAEAAGMLLTNTLPV